MALPIEIILGIYLGVLTGIFPALVAWGLGFLFKYFTGVSIPGFGVVVLALALAGLNGGLLALSDPQVLQSGFRIIVALIVVLMLALYAHAKGDQMGAALPKRFSLATLRDRTLSSDVVELVGGRQEVTVEVTGEIRDIEGYPPLTEETRQAIRTGEWRLPAAVQIAELESRFEERLRTDLDLAEVEATIDAHGQATVSAAPPLSGLSKRVPQGTRAVSVEALVPTGMARGDEVTLITPAGDIDGTIVSAKSGEATPAPAAAAPSSPAADGGSPDEESPPSPPAAATTTGGEGRITVAVSRPDATTLLAAERARVVVNARGTHREFELLSLLRQAGKRFRKLTVRPGGVLDGTTLGAVDVQDSYGVAVLAVRRPDGWIVAPRGSTPVEAGDELYAVGRREALAAFLEVTA